MWATIRFGLSGVRSCGHKLPLVDCLRGGCSRYGQRIGGDEQRLQEQPSRVVRFTFRHPAPHTDWTQLKQSQRSDGWIGSFRWRGKRVKSGFLVTAVTWANHVTATFGDDTDR